MSQFSPDISIFPDPPIKPLFPYSSDSTFHPFGLHKNGDYIGMYVPTKPCSNPPKLVIYLHGFALGVPYFYDAHLQHLAKQGYYVFFPDYQKDSYDNFDPKQRINSIGELIDAVKQSLQSSPEDWIKAAIQSTLEAFQKLKLPSDVDTYLFGHSLGGLFALSWPHYIKKFASELHISQEQHLLLLPKKVIAADPVTHSSSIPANLLQYCTEQSHLDSLLSKQQISIDDTGKDLTMPIAILHGEADAFVGPGDWKDPLENAMPNCPKKIMCLSHSDGRNPFKPLKAYHNQAVTNTDILASAVTMLIGGSGQEDDMRWRYIWSGLDQVIKGMEVDLLKFDMDKWSDNKPVNPITVFFKNLAC